MSRTATCACGQVRVDCTGEPVMVSLCHCLACQKRTGSTYGLGAFFARAQVKPSGATTAYTRTGDSGHDVTFHFCPSCGSTVYWEPARRPDIVAVAVGAFADPSFPAPTQAVHDVHRHEWVVVPGAQS